MEAASLRYLGLRAAGKKNLLDELDLLTGFHPKSLLLLLNRRPSPTPDGVDAMEEKSGLKPHPRRRYGPEAAVALAALLLLLVELLEQHGQLFLAQDANAKPVLTMAEQKELEKLRAQDQREIKALRKELQRKEKAMAEMAALLVLQKKWDAFCSEDEEG